MHFLDGALFPENQQKLVITAAPYGPEWLPTDFPEDIAVSMDDQVQKAVDCYNAGATVLHVHVREADGKGSKRLSKFNELLARLRDRGARHGAAGRRLDLLRAGDRRRQGEVALRRHPPHAGRASADAGPGDGHRQHVADEHRRADGARRPRRDVARPSPRSTTRIAR